MRPLLWIFGLIVAVAGCSGKAAVIEGSVKVTSTADLGKTAGTGK